MSKEKERLHFKWEKSFNTYFFFISMLIALVVSRDILSNKFLIDLFLIDFFISLCFIIIGMELIFSGYYENKYSKLIEDKRIKNNKSNIIDKIGLILHYILGGIIIYLGLSLLYLILFK